MAIDSRVIQRDIEALSQLMLALNEAADKLPKELMSCDLETELAKALRIQMTYVVLKETIPNLLDKHMNVDRSKEAEPWSFWAWLKQKLME